MAHTAHALALFAACLGLASCIGPRLGSEHLDDLGTYKYIRLVDVPLMLRDRVQARLRECHFAIPSEGEIALLSPEERVQILDCSVSWSHKKDDLDEKVSVYAVPGSGFPPEEVTERRSTMAEVRVTVVLRDARGRAVYKGMGRETGSPATAFAAATDAALAGLVAARGIPR